MSKILYVDMDNVIVDFPSAFPHLSLEILQEYEDRLDEVPGIFALMEPLPQAIASFEELATKFDTYILSTSPWGNPSAWSDKLLWVKRYLGEVAYKRLILSHHKHLNSGDFLIDDRTKNGADRFQGEHILFGSDKFPDWPSVVDYLNGKIM
jgi:5'(3')-deoxyribonucleotidase